MDSINRNPLPLGMGRFNVTKEWLKSINLYESLIVEAEKTGVIGLPLSSAIGKMIMANKFHLANEFIAHALDKTGKVIYAVYAAEAALPLWKKEYPDDNRPQRVIDSVNLYVIVPMPKGRGLQLLLGALL